MARLLYFPGYDPAVLEKPADPDVDPVPQNTEYIRLYQAMSWPEANKGSREERREIRRVKLLLKAAGEIHGVKDDNAPAGSEPVKVRRLKPCGAAIVFDKDKTFERLTATWDAFTRAAGFDVEQSCAVDDRLDDVPRYDGDKALQAALEALPAGTFVVTVDTIKKPAPVAALPPASVED